MRSGLGVRTYVYISLASLRVPVVVRTDYISWVLSYFQDGEMWWRL